MDRRCQDRAPACGRRNFRSAKRTLSADSYAHPCRSTRRFDTNFMQLYHRRAMGQRQRAQFLSRIFWLALTVSGATGCDRSPAHAPTSAPARVTVASLVPAATDLILNMGSADQLVAVSNYDISRPGTEGLPRVGDYLNNDWEKLAEIRPHIMITQYDP